MQYLFIHYTFIYIVNHDTEMVSETEGATERGECLPTVWGPGEES